MINIKTFPKWLKILISITIALGLLVLILSMMYLREYHESVFAFIIVFAIVCALAWVSYQTLFRN